MSHSENLHGTYDQEQYSIMRRDKRKEKIDDAIRYHFLWGTD